MKKNQPTPEETVPESTPEAESTPEVEQDSTEEEPTIIEVVDASGEDDQLQRLKAEYDNFRKRTAKEKIALKDEALRQTALAFLPVYDNLDRALKQSCQDEAFRKGVEMTMAQMQGIFDKLELEKISAVGELFDPNLHEALARVDDDRWGENTITEVFMEGFMHRDKVIRFAQVRVAN